MADLDLLKTVGQVAGIGGIALGIFLLICKELIRKAIFPKLTKQQSSKIILSIAFMAWTVALAGIGAWVYVNKTSSGPDERVSQLYTILRPPFVTYTTRFAHGPRDCRHHAVEILSVNDFQVDLEGLTCSYTINKHNTGNCRGLPFDEERPPFYGQVVAQIAIQNNRVIIFNITDQYPNNLQQDTKAGSALVQHFESKNGSIIQQ